MVDSGDTLKPPEVKPTIDDLLPPGYPKYVFHGTSTSNLEQINQLGLAVGTCTSSMFDATNPRYSRKDGCILVCPYSDSEFRNAGPDGIFPNHYYTVKALQTEKIKFTYNHRDTDGVPFEDKTYETDRYITSDKVGAFRISPEQKVYLAMIADLLNGSSPYYYIRDVDPGKIKTIEQLVEEHDLDRSEIEHPVDILFNQGVVRKEESVMDWDVYQRQKYAARCLDLNPEDFRTIESLRAALAPHCHDESSFVEFALRNFPGQVEWVSRHYEIRDEELLGQIVVQAHQLDIVSETEALLSGRESDYNPLFPDSENMRKLSELQKNQIRPPPTEPEPEPETRPDEAEMVTAQKDYEFIMD